MKQVISHNTRDLTIGGIIDQDELKIGTPSGSVAGIFFDNGKENLPGIRFYKDDNEEYIFHFDTSTGVFAGSNSGWPEGEEAVFHYVCDITNTPDPGRKGYIATSSTGVNLGLTGSLTSSSTWMIVRAYNSEQPNNGPIVASSVSNTMDPSTVSWRCQSTGATHDNVCTTEYIPPTQEWQYSVDGSDWQPIKMESAGLAYEVIDIEPSHLDANGIVTIQHNLGKKYPIGLDFTVMPDAIEYTDANTLKLDYSSHGSASSVISKVWFLNSQPSMIVIPEQGGSATNNENGGEA